MSFPVRTSRLETFRPPKPRWVTALMAVLFAGATLEQILAARSWGHDDWGMTDPPCQDR